MIKKTIFLNSILIPTLLASLLLYGCGSSNTSTVRTTISPDDSVNLQAGMEILVTVYEYDPNIADGPATKVFQKTVTYENEGSLTFSLDVENVNEEYGYYVTIFVDVDGDGEFSDGDYVHNTFNKVITLGNPTQITISIVELDLKVVY